MQPTEKNFGYTFAGVFLLISGYIFYKTEQINLYTLSLAIIFFIVTIFTPKFLKPLNLIWYQFGLLLSKITTPIILFLIYYLVIVPFGLYFKLFKKDNLGLKFDKSSKSYWVNKQYKSKFENQF
ncbi:MAG: hypothetical protein J0H68_05950 [Sphingobacteriia bacterium]|nr:hypothetical protein [Sphingobacteriia bacterium]